MNKIVKVTVIVWLCLSAAFAQGPMVNGVCAVYSTLSNAEYDRQAWGPVGGGSYDCLGAVIGSGYYGLQYASPTGFCQGRPVPGQPGVYAETSDTLYTDFSWSCDYVWEGESYGTVANTPVPNGLIESISELVGWLGEYYGLLQNNCVNDIVIGGVPSGFTLLDC